MSIKYVIAASALAASLIAGSAMAEPASFGGTGLLILVGNDNGQSTGQNSHNHGCNIYNEQPNACP